MLLYSLLSKFLLFSSLLFLLYSVASVAARPIEPGSAPRDWSSKHLLSQRLILGTLWEFLNVWGLQCSRVHVIRILLFRASGLGALCTLADLTVA